MFEIKLSRTKQYQICSALPTWSLNKLGHRRMLKWLYLVSLHILNFANRYKNNSKWNMIEAKLLHKAFSLIKNSLLKDEHGTEQRRKIYCSFKSKKGNSSKPQVLWQITKLWIIFILNHYFHDRFAEIPTSTWWTMFSGSKGKIAFSMHI